MSDSSRPEPLLQRCRGALTAAATAAATVVGIRATEATRKDRLRSLQGHGVRRCVRALEATAAEMLAAGANHIRHGDDDTRTGHVQHNDYRENADKSASDAAPADCRPGQAHHSKYAGEIAAADAQLEFDQPK